MRYLENALWMLPAAALLSAIVYGLILLVLKSKRKLPIVKHIANYTLIGFFTMLIWAVFFWAFPSRLYGIPTFNANLVPFSEVVYAYTEDGGAWSSQVMWNVFLFIPLGFLLPCVFERLRKGAWKTILICLALTVCIELIQFLIGRTADIDDVLCNLIGGVFGHAVYVILGRLFRKVEWTKCILVDYGQRYRLVLSWLVVILTLGVPTIGDLILHYS